MKTVPFNNVYLNNTATVTGKLEKEGPLGSLFDIVEEDTYFGMRSWEMGESEMVRRALNTLLAKSKINEKDIDLILGGDLLNQCTATSFAVECIPASFIGLYGACSTAVESIIMGSEFVEFGRADNAVAVASSHFCSSERQFRFPLEYGNQRPPMAQTTVTGAGAFLLSKKESPIRVKRATVGKVKDSGITDANNMGAAMANAAVDTILRFFNDTGEDPLSYDVIATGDLGKEGLEIAKELFIRCKTDIGGRLTDCGILIYDTARQDVKSGGSGCGCSACVLGSLFYKKLIKNEAKRILLVGTGALLSPKTVLQKRSIPSIAHLVELERV